MQRALNDRGAQLAVDGEWGPRSGAAWVELLRSEGIEAAVPAGTMWLTPEVGAALGKPADEFVVAALSAG